jgi:hypothetical protein
MSNRDHNVVVPYEWRNVPPVCGCKPRGQRMVQANSRYLSAGRQRVKWRCPRCDTEQYRTVEPMMRKLAKAL